MATRQKDEELQAEVKSTILRPLADKFQELTRQIDSGKYKLPKTVEEAEVITENYIEQAWQRLEPLIKARDEQREPSIEALKDIIVHAAPDGTQDDGEFIGFYVLPTGPVHRGLVALQAVGQARETMGDVAVISRYQAHLEQREREIKKAQLLKLKRFLEILGKTKYDPVYETFIPRELEGLTPGIAE